LDVDFSLDVAFFGWAGVNGDFFADGGVPFAACVDYFQANFVRTGCRKGMIQGIALFYQSAYFPIYR